MSDWLIFNSIYKNEKTKENNINMNIKKHEIYLPFDINEKIDKNNDYYKNNLLNLTKKYNILNSYFYGTHHDYKKSENRKKLLNKLSNLNDEVKLFERHLKEIRKKSIETNSKLENLLGKRRKHIYFGNL